MIWFPNQSSRPPASLCIFRECVKYGHFRASQVALVGKKMPKTWDAGLIPGSGRSSGGGNGNPLQCSCLENPTDRGAWRATVHGVTESETTQVTWHAGTHGDFTCVCAAVLCEVESTFPCLPAWTCTALGRFQPRHLQGVTGLRFPFCARRAEGSLALRRAANGAGRPFLRRVG